MGCHGTPTALRRPGAGARRRKGFLVRKPTQRIDARSLSTPTYSNMWLSLNNAPSPAPLDAHGTRRRRLAQANGTRTR